MNSAIFWSGMEWLGLALLGWHLLAFVLCGMGLLLVRFLQRQGPALRSHVLRATLLGILGLPGFALLTFPGNQAITKSTETGITEIASRPFSDLEWENVAVWRPILQEMSAGAADLAADDSFRFSWRRLLAGLAVLCLVLLGAGLIRLGRGMSRNARRIATARACEENDRERCGRVAGVMGIRAPQVLISSEIRSPMVAGVFGPVLFLPENLTAGEEVWRHELSHIRHGDILWNLLATGLAFCFPLQPLFSLLRKAMMEAAEERCDDAVLLQGGDKHTYAGLLVDLAEKGAGMEVCSLPMARSSMLERRLTRFLNVSWVRQTRTPRGIWAAALCMVMLGICGAGWAFADMRGSMVLAGITQVSESKPETKEYNFQVLPITDYWKKQGFSHRLVFLEVNGRDKSPAYYFLSDKIAEYLEALPGKKVNVTVLEKNGANREVTRIGDLELSKLAPDQIQKQWSAILTGQVQGNYTLKESPGFEQAALMGAPSGSSTSPLDGEAGMKLQVDPQTQPGPLALPADLQKGGTVTLSLKPSLSLVRSVQVEFAGSPNLSQEEVIAISGLKINEIFRSRDLRRAVKALYATGKFSNLRVTEETDKEGVKILIIVQPAPVVNQVEWQAAAGIPTEGLESLIKTRKGKGLSEYQMFEDAAVLQKHLGQGKRVTAEMVRLDQEKSTADVVFHIQ